MREERNKARTRYQPKTINVLYIGESPPFNNTYFYFENSNLFDKMEESFKTVFKDLYEKENFLKYFMKNNFFLDDLREEPINQIKDKKLRAEERTKGIPELATKLKIYNPRHIIILMKGIENDVRDAINSSSIAPEIIFPALTFPSYSVANKIAFVKGNVSILKDLQREGR